VETVSRENVSEPTAPAPPPKPAGLVIQIQGASSLNGAFVIWLLAFEWLFQLHALFVSRYRLPLTTLDRFLILVAAAAVGLLVAVALKRGRRYLALILMAVFWPVIFIVFVTATAVAAPFTLPQRWARFTARLRRRGRFFSSVAGKVLVWAGMLFLVAAVASTHNARLLLVETVLLGALALAFLAGFLHTSANPLMLVEFWQRFQLNSMRGLGRVARWLSRNRKQDPLTDYHVSAAAFATVQLAGVRGAVGTWRHLSSYLAWLLVATLTSVLVFAGLHDALLRLVPVPGLALPDGYWTRVSLCISVMGGKGAPDQLLYPFSIHTVIVALEMLSAVFFFAVTALAFTAMAQDSASAMQDRVSAMWRAEAEEHAAAMRGIMPVEEYAGHVNDAVRKTWSDTQSSGPASAPPIFTAAPPPDAPDEQPTANDR
jgi:hypothetical protein